MSEWLTVLSTCLSAFVRYCWALRDALPVLLGLAAVLFVLSSRRGREWWAGSTRVVRGTLSAALILLSFVPVWQQASLLDDAYISLRYADNLVQGNGLVFNVGERIEGYTNFLWTVLLAAGMRIGLDGEQLAVVACVICYVLELLLVMRLGRLLRQEESRASFPWAALFLGANLVFTAYGTTGMETMFATLLVTVAFERALIGKWFVAGVAGIAATLAHPDHGLMYAGLGFCLLLDKQQRRQIFAYSAPFVLVYVPYFLARWKYYGDFFPNTYYAKSGGLPYFTQGTIYFVVCFLATGLLGLLPLFFHGLRTRRSTLLRRYLLFACGPYLLYLIKLGGDFMLGRLFVPVLPFFALLAEEGYDALLSSARRRLALVATACFAIACAPVRMLPARSILWGLSDESTWFQLTSFFPVSVNSPFLPRTVGLKKLADAGIRPLVCDANIGLSGYKTKLPMIDVQGLTDWEVAHQPLKKRGRPGHEKLAQPTYLYKRGVQLSVISFYAPRKAPRTVVKYEDFPFYISSYDAEFLEKIKPFGFVPPETPREIDELIARADGYPAEVLADETKFYETFYFSKNPDPERRQRLQAALARRQGAPIEQAAPEASLK